MFVIFKVKNSAVKTSGVTAVWVTVTTPSGTVTTTDDKVYCEVTDNNVLNKILNDIGKVTVIGDAANLQSSITCKLEFDGSADGDPHARVLTGWNAMVRPALHRAAATTGMLNL